MSNKSAGTAEMFHRFGQRDLDGRFGPERAGSGSHARAKSFGMPLREAMAHLGHGSKAVHQAYSESAEIVTLPLEFYEKQHRDKILQFTANQESSPATVAGGRP